MRRRPLVAVSSTCFTPLQFKEEDLNIMMRAGRAGAPTSVTSIGMAGASCPVTISGTLVVTLAEMLAGLTISQLANPGAPIFFTPKMMVMDMLTGMGKQGSTEGAIYSVALAQIIDRHVHVPLNLNGFAADSMVVDGQSQAERLVNCMLAALNSPAISMSAGKLEAGNTSSPLQLAMDDQYWSIISRLQRGVEVSDEALAASVIREVGHEGSYVGEPHTLEYFRTEQVVPSAFNRQSREIWSAQGARTFEDRVREGALRVIEERKGDRLPAEVIEEMEAIVNEADERMT
ncbi:MAG: trimethylamine methyltransferase family protein [Thermoleophilia bacterium]|nr:trimethylamine methyltransferase family protein [Thermoleophilia bacterium]